MGKRATIEQTERDGIVCRVGRRLYNHGYDVAVDGRCDFPERISLPIFSRYPSGCGDEKYRRPDIYAERYGETVIGEVETAETISSERTRCQLATFSMNGYIVVYVPSHLVTRMQDNIRRWGLTNVTVKGY